MKNNDTQYQPWEKFNALGLKTLPGSYFTGYWPYFARLGLNGQIAMWRNIPYSPFQYNQTENWLVWNMPSIAAMAGSKLAVVPLGPNMTSVASWGNYGLFYQNLDGNLAFAQQHRTEAESKGILVDSWPTGEFPAELKSAESILNLMCAQTHTSHAFR